MPEASAKFAFSARSDFGQGYTELPYSMWLPFPTAMDHYNRLTRLNCSGLFSCFLLMILIYASV